MDVINISTFKATCLKRLDTVRRTGRPLLVTRKGEPIAEIRPPSATKSAARWIGSMAGTGRITGDIVSSATEPDDWDALR
jgi:antitoxin (DNA-binding transcriptional repressor) of toxin-antitoxin stability system